MPRLSSGRPRRRIVRILITSVVFASVLSGVSATTAWVGYRHYNGQITRVNVLKPEDPNIVQPARQLHAANYLVLGSDSRAGVGGSFGNEPGERSDTTMIVHLSPARTKATVISIPRDSAVTVPACRNRQGVTVPAHVALFNAAFSIGGAACTVATVQKLTGIEITHYVSIDLAGFIRVVNALGTITVCSPVAVSDPKSTLQLHKGNNELNGSQALAYVRARETLGDGSDIGRIQRQQRFLGAVLREVRGGKLLSGPTTLTTFLDAATKAVTIDKKSSIGDLRTLLDVLRGLDPAKVTFYTAPIARSNYDPSDPTSQTGVNILLDQAQGRILYDQVINDQTITVGGTTTGPSSTLTVAPGAIRVRVVNGTLTGHLTSAVRRALTSHGFRSASSGPPTDDRASTTVITFARSQFAAAQTVAAAFPHSRMHLATRHTGPVRVTIGSDYRRARTVATGQALPSWVLKQLPKSPRVAPSTGFSADDRSCTI